MQRLLRKFTDDRRGATAVEYSMIAIMVSIVIVASTRAIGTTVSATFIGKLLAQVDW